METGSVTRAGSELHVSQPAVSKLLGRLTDRCGFKLFTQSGGRLVPTAEARLLAIEVDRLFAGTARIGQVVDALRDRQWGQVSIAALPALALRFLPRLLARYLSDRPDVRLSLQSRTSPRVGELVASQQIDLGLSLLPIEHPYVSAEVIARFALVCILPAGHHLGPKTVITPEDLRNEPFIALGREDRSSFVVDQAFIGRAERRRVRIEAQMAESACSFVASGLGVSIVPPFAAADYPSELLMVRQFEPQITMDVWLLLPTSRTPSRITELIADGIRDSLAIFDVRANEC